MLDNVSTWSTSFDPTDEKPYPLWFVILMWILTGLFSLETIFGNLLVLWAYRIERNIRRQLSNKFIVSLAISDLIIGMEGFPILTVYVLDKERWPLGVMMCKIWLCIDYTLCLVSILTVLLITIDRYCSVCYPAKYRMWQSPRRITIMIITSWISPMALFSFMIFAWELMTNESAENETVKCYAPFLNNPYVNMSMYIVYYWTTLIAMSILYRGIHIAAKALEERSKAKEKQTLALMLGQRCMAQVGVGMFMNALSSKAAETDTRDDTAGHQTTQAANVDNAAEYTEMVHDSGYITVTTAGTTSLTNDSKSRRLFETKVETEAPGDTGHQTQAIVDKTIEYSELVHNLVTTTLAFEPIETTETVNVQVPEVKTAIKLQKASGGDSMDYCDNISCDSSFADPSITSLLDFDQTILSTNLHFIEEENSEESSVTLCGVANCTDASSIKNDDFRTTIPPTSFKSVPNALSQPELTVSPGRPSIIDKNVFTDMSKTVGNSYSGRQECSSVAERSDSPSSQKQHQKRKSDISSRGTSIHLTVPTSSIVPTNSRKFKRTVMWKICFSAKAPAVISPSE
uniref:G-protein coupled receptors family 1 profile domain-containing protein n=1 Tax=Romanomermis culicivorax TaxID=13658 RepID=A0A915HN01_ROMCU